MFHIRLLAQGFEWLICASVGLGHLLCGNPAKAAECGSSSPDYTARRILVIGQETKVSKVYVSGFKVREEESSNDGKQTVVLRLPEQGVSYILDPDGKTALLFPLPPGPGATKQRTRQAVDKRPDGTVVRRFQILSGGEWRDISTTTCRPDGVMLEQEFTFVDPHGHLLVGRLTQSIIDVGPLPKTLFDVPGSIEISDPRIQRPQPWDHR